MGSTSETTETRRHGDLTKEIIGCAIEVHRTIGPGLLESVYQRCLCHEFEIRGISHQCEVPLSLGYKGLRLDDAYRIDVVVRRCVALELKAVTQVLPVHRAQILTYLRLARLRTGLILNFHEPRIVDGIERWVL